MIRETRHEVIDIMYICDFCGHEATNMHVCLYCHRHACGDHFMHVTNDPITGVDYGDYPERICIECYQKIHTGKIAKLIDEYKQRSNELDNFQLMIEDEITKQCRVDINGSN